MSDCKHENIELELLRVVSLTDRIAEIECQYYCLNPSCSAVSKPFVRIYDSNFNEELFPDYMDEIRKEMR